MGTQQKPAYYDHIAPAYDRERYQDSPYFPLMAQVMLFVKKTPSPKILEIGCGTGMFAHFLYDEGFRDYRGYDFSEKSLEIARKKAPQIFLLASAEGDSPYQWDYNLAVFMEVLEHLENDFAPLEKLKNGTKVIITLPKFDDPGHIRFFKKARQIKRRYHGYIDIEKVVPINTWFVLYGTMKPQGQRELPFWWNRL